MKSYLLLCLFLIPAHIFAQKTEGRVMNNQGSAVENAYIYNLNTGAHAHSNALGLFVLNQSHPGDSLQISLIGHTSLRTSVSGAFMHITLNEAPFELEQVVITPGLKSLNSISAVNLNLKPVRNSQEVLRVVPGLFIGQHAGGGKAEQFFLRGFDIDHGTDLRITADGTPVNMVSHAHGQGYADLHFLIPETIEKVEFDKGPYHAEQGNFATAGYVALHTYEKLDENKLSLEYGDFNTLRMVGLYKLLNKQGHHAYLASEYSMTDGPFESPQHFDRLNLMGKYTGWISPASKLSLQASVFRSQWDASGQIPQRAVNAEMISRFGAIDDTEGGQTGRVNLIARLDHMIDEQSSVQHRIYYSAYDFELYSNFSFFLHNPLTGDQIRQREHRSIYGFESLLQKNIALKAMPLALKVGTGLRKDLISDNELSYTLNRRTTITPLSLGDINESNLYGFADAELRIGKWLINPALRLDYFDFQYQDQLLNQYLRQSENKVLLSPKLNFIFSPDPLLQLYLKNGLGFHSNDTRVVVRHQARHTVPAAYGTDLGLNWKPSSRLLLNAAAWHLFMEQEFIYVGDEAVVEPGGRTRRMGLDLGLRYQLLNWLFADADLTYAHARAIDETEGENFIPLAPIFTATAGLSVREKSGFSGSLRGRYLGDRPATEDYSRLAEGYFVTDLSINHCYKSFSYGLTIENLFNTAWNETQFDTQSRLAHETEAVSEIHFTPGTPFFLRGRLQFCF